MWRETGRKARFFFMSGFSALPLAIYFVQLDNLFFLFLALSMMGFFYFIERKGYTVKVFYRLIRSKAIGNKRLAKTLTNRRFFK